MLRNALALALLVGTVACSATASAQVTDRSVAVQMPSPHIDGLHPTAEEGTLSAADAALDAVDPTALQGMLEGAGLVGVREQTYAGGRGVFSRVVIRGWEFTTNAGGQTFVSWLRAEGGRDLYGETKVVPVDDPGLSMFVHPVTGCCHEEVPIYLAVWQRGPIVWTVRASGARIRTQPVMALVRSIRREA
jgi:hypothetical protein